MIKGRPALTQIDHEKVGDFVLITVRDPLCAYDVDPAKKIADRLEHAELIGNSGMFTSYSGIYKGGKHYCGQRRQRFAGDGTDFI